MGFNMPSFLETLFGSPAKTGSTYNKGQLSSLDNILESIRGMRGGAQDITQQPGYQQGNNWLMSLFNDPQFFNSFEAPLQRQFQEQTVPDLANRFAAMGSGGALGSTGFRNQLAREGSNLSTNIAALRGGLQQQGVNQGLQYAQQPFSNLMSLYQQALQPTQNTYQPASGGLLGPALGSIAGGFGGGFGNIFGQGMANRFPGQNPSTF
jgi:hypothetical protein